jgi:hypothetical protein
MEEYVSTKIVCVELKLRYGQVMRLIRKKKLDAIKAEGGWGWLVKKASVDSFKCNRQ